MSFLIGAEKRYVTPSIAQRYFKSLFGRLESQLEEDVDSLQAMGRSFLNVTESRFKEIVTKKAFSQYRRGMLGFLNVLTDCPEDRVVDEMNAMRSKFLEALVKAEVDAEHLVDIAGDMSAQYEAIPTCPADSLEGQLVALDQFVDELLLSPLRKRPGVLMQGFEGLKPEQYGQAMDILSSQVSTLLESLQGDMVEARDNMRGVYELMQRRGPGGAAALH